MPGKRSQWLGRNHQYRLVSVIAVDRLGWLWRAENAFLSQPVTARVLRQSLGSDPEFVARFRRVMDQVSREVVHPNAAAVFNYNWGDDGPTQFIVMEAVEGEPLAQRIGRGMDTARSLRIVAQVADAVQAAHAAGIVHGNLSPTTVMLSAHDGVKVLDFGLGAAAWDRPLTLGRGDAYVPPEWVLAAKRRPSWDAYAVAVLLHHLLTGTPDLPEAGLVTAGNGSTGLAADDPDTAREIFPRIGEQLARTWCRALARDPRDRPRVEELSAALRPVDGRERRAAEDTP